MELVVPGLSLAYLCFGLLLMDFMCPCWHPFEKLIGAIIWPISAVIGIVVSLREPPATPMLDNWMVYQIAMTLILAEEARKEMERAQKVSQAQAPVDQAAHDEHGRNGQSLPC